MGLAYERKYFELVLKNNFKIFFLICQTTFHEGKTSVIGPVKLQTRSLQLRNEDGENQNEL